VNWSASNATRIRDFVSAAIGFRVTPPTKPYDFGFGWEFPLTCSSSGILENVFMLDMVIKF
tara:strand:- start:2938 stop:3120 length:183 start_codon:yes stop_codon:yes gene_type:complete